MNTSKFARNTILMMFLAVPTVSQANSWICENANLVREINIERKTTAAAPCSVKYDKEAEGLGTAVLWTAQNDGAYCDAKASGLADKLSSSGWSCTQF